MAGKKTAVFGIYKTRDQAELSVDRLLASGYTNDDISVLLPDRQSTKEFSHEKNTKAPEGTAAGATAGGAIGGTLGLLAGIGMLAIPGIGPLIAAGPIVASLAGLGVGGAVGGLIGALVGMGIPEEDATFYAEGVKRGGVLVTVQTSDDRASEALSIMRRSNAVDVDTQRRSWTESGWSGRFDTTAEPDESYTWSWRPRY